MHDFDMYHRKVQDSPDMNVNLFENLSRPVLIEKISHNSNKCYPSILKVIDHINALMVDDIVSLLVFV